MMIAGWLAEPQLAGRLVRLRPMGSGAAAFTRSACEGWWARQDSNLQPDRYERPALTIELQAPPECRIKRPATVPTPLTMLPAIRQCRVPRFGTFAQPTALRAG